MDLFFIGCLHHLSLFTYLEGKLTIMQFLKKKHATVGATIFATETINHLFDFLLFPLLLIWFGTILGWAIVTLFAIILNYQFIFLYKKVGLHEAVQWIHDKKAKKAENVFDKFVKYLFHLGHIPTFIFLSWEDPSKAFFYIRGHKLGQSFSLHDWITLFVSNAVGTLIWTGMWGTGISLFRHILHF